MKIIQLTQEQVTIVDDQDYVELSQWKWYAQWNEGKRSFYAVRNSPRDPLTKKQRIFYMHRAIIGCLEAGRTVHVDHKNHNTLDNQRENLKVTNARGNQSNLQGKNEGKYSSKYVGVCWDKHKQKWRAQITINGKIKNLGGFASEQEASAAYQISLQGLGRP